MITLWLLLVWADGYGFTQISPMRDAMLCDNAGQLYKLEAGKHRHPGFLCVPVQVKQ